jgi:hypothetical protein
VPRTVAFKEIKSRKPPQPATAPASGGGEPSVETGQTVLNLNGASGNGNVTSHEGENGDEASADPNAQLELEMSMGDERPASAGMNGHGSSQDVEMSQ